MRVTSDVGPWSITPEWVLDSDISDRAVRLYALLGRYANSNGESFPSRQTLATRLRCSESSAIRASRELEQAGALQITKRRDANGDSATNLYRLIYVSPLTGGGVTADTTPGVTGDTQNENQDERETPLAAAPHESVNGKIRKVDRDLIWDTLTDIFGPVTTRTAETLRGKHVTELAHAGATRDEILRRARTWPNHFETATLTAAALVKHWDALGRKPLRRT